VEEEDEFLDEKFLEDEFVDEEFKHGDVHDDVEHEDVDDPSQEFVDWILYQRMILISMMKILWEVRCRMINRKNL
jgi:hypothetical protein